MSKDEIKIRTCVFTGRKSKSKSRVIHEQFCGNEEKANWVNFIPISGNYENFKKDRLPNELEMKANEYFRMLELYKLRVKFYETKLRQVQKKLEKQYENWEKTRPALSNTKLKKLNKMEKLNTTIEEAELELEKILEEREKASFFDTEDENE